MGKEWAKDLVHIPYGTMSMGGEKLASRKGNIVPLDDLFYDAIEKAEKIIEEKNSELKDKINKLVIVNVLDNDKEVGESRQLIKTLVKEIDKCVAMLNAEQ